MISLDQKRNRLFTILAGIFITNALLAEMIGVKIFSAESTLGLQPAHLNIMGFTMDFNLTAGAIIWPVVFITTDLINEYFGKPGVKRISYFTAFLISYAFLVIFLSIRLSPADFWTLTKDADGNSFNMDLAFNKIFGQGQRIIIGSLAAFLIGQLVDVFVFQQLRKVTGSKKLWLRATGSTLVSQFIDSFVVLFIAFYGVFTNEQIVAIGITNYIYKFSVAILLTPVIYLGHSLIDQYLGKEAAEKISADAAKESQGFF
ncbi:queuosine precursor transporter [Chryseolinea sp. H1M3-3]|uniref:queuosine precursor transporter n=1 Tax=Chryseolinea sp. H1M3-3 TaxID=3034144 RepID=UPI0023ED7CB2|nr:queuosine precursor transporter [Chryseolinea sp. H1M3-3]